MKFISKIITIIIILFSCFTIKWDLYSQEDSFDEIEKDEEEMELDENAELDILLNNYEEMVINNANWNDKNLVIKEIKKYIDGNYHNKKAYDILVKWYYNNHLLYRVRQYGQKSIDISNKLGIVYFTRDLLYYMGKYYIESDKLDYAKALGYLNIVNSMGKDDYPLKADLFYHIGLCYKELHSVRSLSNNRYAYLAEAAFEFALYLEKDINYHYQLGQVYEILNKYEQALEIYEKALKINPSFEKINYAKNQLIKKMEN